MRFRAAAQREAAGVILLDGAHLVGEALAAGVRFQELAVAAGAEADPQIDALIRRLAATGIEPVSVTAPVMAALSPVRSPSPIVALAERPAAGLKDDAHNSLFVAAMDIQDPGNVGAVVRVAEAAGATGVFLGGTSADPFGWKALRGSMGSALRLPIALRKGPLSYDELRGLGCRILATAPRSGRLMYDVDLRQPAAFVIGGEGGGLSERQLAEADEVVTIPMCPPVESLNAAVTAALLLYEARRQRL